MTHRRWLPPPIVLLALTLACGFVIWNSVVRSSRISAVSDIGAEALVPDAASATGYAGGVRKLIVPAQNYASYEWIIQTQAMLAKGEGRTRHANYDNAPAGRMVHLASPYRWWLGLVAGGIYLVTGEPSGVAVEHAALIAGPLAHGLLIIVTAFFFARFLGTLAGAFVAIGLAGLYPFGSTFLPGQPDDYAIACASMLWSVLLLLAGLGQKELQAAAGQTGGDLGHAMRRWFLWSGIAGGVGLWISARVAVPLHTGVALGGMVCAWMSRRASRGEAPEIPLTTWRAWGFGGAATSAAAYLIEYFPSHLDVQALRLEVNHPLYALAWLGVGECVGRVSAMMQQGSSVFRKSDVARMALAILAVAAVPAALLLHSTKGVFALHPFDSRLSPLADAPIAAHLGEWISRDGISAAAFATFLPSLLLVSAAGWLLVRRNAWGETRSRQICLALGPVLIAIGFAAFRIRGWSAVDAGLLALLAACMGRGTIPSSQITRWFYGGAAATILTPSLWLLSLRGTSANDTVTESDAQSLVERDLGHWLAARAGAEPVTFLAPPNLTSSVIFYSGERGITTPYWENLEGFTAAARIAGTTTMAEADSLMRRREATYIIVPSWDSALDDYARLGANAPDATLMGHLRRWLPPLWLRPLAYKLPLIDRFEGRSIAIFALTDVQDDALALSRLAEYFAEMGQLDFALRVIGTLQSKYPEDFNSLIAQAQVAATNNDAKEFGKALSAIVPLLAQEQDTDLPWDRRLSLATTLAQGKRLDLAEVQLKQCLEELDEALLRSLSIGSVFRLLSLCQRTGLEIPDATSRTLAPNLLLPEMRARL